MLSGAERFSMCYVLCVIADSWGMECAECDRGSLVFIYIKVTSINIMGTIVLDVSVQEYRGFVLIEIFDKFLSDTIENKLMAVDDFYLMEIKNDIFKYKNKNCCTSIDIAKCC